MGEKRRERGIKKGQEKEKYDVMHWNCIFRPKPLCVPNLVSIKFMILNVILKPKFLHVILVPGNKCPEFSTQWKTIRY